ncbi:MAG: TetR/AcrR family transcriptional regulator [Sphingomonadaceae bacterium]|uniref:TetR/AcrR family transcriptional regulator n=1 Tax=Thermaurantiacus sp. TaxID=2820283 RepID=UPI00298F221A|nr:TetR/AcrR family transcriptional regulator [Thermaurantiacus sp.]MCS6987592.1 TetR/AcrR family transcriptional regulator [Sphingomonadaceae bacterium]MDW8415193.1 TetR/AcrR family transcriptional regulator [Thermaurantiacus sp.]
MSRPAPIAAHAALSPSPPGRREAAKADRRARILKAARDLIRETGETDLPMRRLAERAGVSLATTYNLFGSKRAVVLAVLEDERDFARRLARLEAPDSLSRLFAAHDLAFSYYAADPDFYRALWRTLLSSSGADETGLASPERIRETRAIWLGLLERAEADGWLAPPVSRAALERTLAQLSAGTLLFWVTGALATERLAPSAGLGWALVLLGCATPAGAPIARAAAARYRAALRAVAAPPDPPAELP